MERMSHRVYAYINIIRVVVVFVLKKKAHPATLAHPFEIFINHIIFLSLCLPFVV